MQLAFHWHFTEIIRKKGFGGLPSTCIKIIKEMSRKFSGREEIRAL